MVDDGSVESNHPSIHSVFRSFQLSISPVRSEGSVILQFATLLFLANNNNKNDDDDDDYNTVF